MRAPEQESFCWKYPKRIKIMLTMKRDQSRQLKSRPQQQGRWLLLVLAWLSIQLPSAWSQGCTLGCNGTLEAPLYVAIDQSCEAFLLVDQILEAPQDCPGPKRMVVRDSVSAFVAEGIGQVTFDASAYIGRRLSVTITDEASGLFCVGFIRIYDNLPPVLANCPDKLVACTEDLRPANLGFPDAFDNCLDSVPLAFRDTFFRADCLSDTAGLLVRRWIARDRVGQADTCFQNITILRTSLDSIVFPQDIVLSCTTPEDAHPDSLGYGIGWPLLDSLPLRNNATAALCALTIVFEDDTTALCGNIEWLIARTWTVTNECTGFSRQATQNIQILDNTPPVITCPAPGQVFPTDPSRCTATLTLPQPTAIDDCSAQITYLASTSYGAVGFEPHPFVPVGVHQIQYIAVDECGNSSTCQTQIVVVDQERPTAVCDDEILIALPNTGLAVAQPVDFDEGSNDNCAPNVFLKARRVITGACDGENGDDSGMAGYQEWFDDRVIFCCEDIGNNELYVILRAYEIFPGNGVVNPNRELPGGDLYNHYSECQVKIRVQDSQAPQFNYCPSNRTITCATNRSNLSTFGSPMVVDNCGFTLDSTAVTTLDDCGRGNIVRTWTATDARGNSRSCSQTITVINNAPLVADSILWPPTYTASVCGASLQPDDLPAEYQRPVIRGQWCGQIGVSYTDEIFDDARPACYRIIRRWRVIDWCHYDGSSAQGPGIFTYNQILRLSDNQPPVLSVPADVVVSIGADCQFAQVNLQPAIAQDCQTNVLITNNSPHATAGGANAGGRYPLGVTTVTFSATDRCGNVATASMTVTVRDNQGPGIICQGGVSSTLMNVNGTPTLTLDPTAFTTHAIDNCANSSNIVRKLRRQSSPSQETFTQLTFGCAERGSQLVEVWAYDPTGNSGFCVTYVAVTDNNNLCSSTNTGGNTGGGNNTGGNNNNGGNTGGTVSGMIAGGILTESGSEVESVEVRVGASNPFMDMTGLDGAFRIEGLTLGQNYTVTPNRNDNPLNGVTTIDLILISKHVLGTARLTSPYKIIAADIDRSGHISTLDIIRLRKLILGVDTQLPNSNTSWRFIDAAFQFPDPNNPFISYFPERVNIDELAGDEMHADFIAVKVGDINDSATPTSFGGVSSRSSQADDAGTLQIEVPDGEYRVGDLIELPFSAEYMNEVMGYQFTLEFDPNALDYLDVEPVALPNLFEENFALINPASGLITTVWNEYGESAPGGRIELFRMQFRARQNGRLKDWLFLGSRLTPAEAYNQEGDKMGVALNFISGETQADGKFELFQNRPNPWKNETIVPFHLDPGGQAKLSIYDMAGKLVYEVEGEYETGYHEIGISRADLPSIGLFYYTLQAGERRATRKMVLTD